MHSIEGALRMSDEINAQLGFERAFGKTNGNADADTKITKFGISFNIPDRSHRESDGNSRDQANGQSDPFAYQ